MKIFHFSGDPFPPPKVATKILWTMYTPDEQSYNSTGKLDMNFP